VECMGKYCEGLDRSWLQQRQVSAIWGSVQVQPVRSYSEGLGADCLLGVRAAGDDDAAATAAAGKNTIKAQSTMNSIGGSTAGILSLPAEGCGRRCISENFVMKKLVGSWGAS